MGEEREAQCTCVQRTFMVEMELLELKFLSELELLLPTSTKKMEELTLACMEVELQVRVRLPRLLIWLDCGTSQLSSSVRITTTEWEHQKTGTLHQLISTRGVTTFLEYTLMVWTSLLSERLQDLLLTTALLSRRDPLCLRYQPTDTTGTPCLTQAPATGQETKSRR